ncbi:Protein C25G4.6, partial [Aphelenchoides avenae]
IKDCFDTNSRLIIKAIVRNSIVDGKLLFGDVLSALNGNLLQSKDQLKQLWKDKTQSNFKVDFKVHRPVVRKDMEPARMPRAYEALTGSRYHIAIMYMVRGCNLSLPIKSFNNKVYVTRVIDDTMASMSLKLGDAVLDVDQQPVANVKDAGELLVKQLESKGYTVEMDLPIPADVNAICKKELARMKAHPDLQPKPILVENDPRSPLKSNKSKSVKKQPAHLKIDDKAEDVPIACDGNPALLVNVPPQPVRASQYQPLTAFTDKK